MVTLKDSIFQPSSPLHYAVELLKVLKTTNVNPVLKLVLFLYTDNSPDHRVAHVSIQAALICVFKHLNLDCLIAARNAPMQSFRNPMEQCMPLLNIRLQAVGVMRAVIDPDRQYGRHQ